MTGAPCATRSSPCATAASWSNHWPPSEKESGVTLTTPMMTGGPGSPGGRISRILRRARCRSPNRRRRVEAGEDDRQLVDVERLALHERRRQPVERGTLLAQQL